MWELLNDSTFFLSALTLIIGLFTVIVKYSYQSKCENIDLCFSCIRIKRRVDLEALEENENNVELQTPTRQTREPV